MSTYNYIYPSTLLLLGLLLLNLEILGAQPVGVCYGRDANNLLPPQQVVNLYQTRGIKKMRIYDPDQTVLEALRGSDIELVVGLPNRDLQSVAQNPSVADQWVQRNIRNFFPAVKFRYIIVGNEVDRTRGDTAQYVDFLLPAMQNIRNALAATGLQDQIKVTTATHSGVLGVSFPPSQGSFRDDIRPFMDSIVRFLAANGSPLFVNIYPYFSYVGNSQISASYALFTSTDVVVTDEFSKLQYRNLFDALLDAHYSALEKVGGFLEKNTGSDVNIKVSETGQPTSTRNRPPLRTENARDDEFATVENARIYNNNLIKHLNSGTPKRPGQAIEAYIFAMFDENLKGGGIEGNFGLFTPDGQPKYPISFTA